MPQTMKAIQEKHDAAANRLISDIRLAGRNVNICEMLDAVDDVRDAFAAAVQHHTDYVTKLKGATKVAREIEGGK